MKKEIKDGFTYDNDKIEGFTAKCECGSFNVSLEYEFNYYGGMTGYDQTLNLRCRDCNKHSFIVI